MATVLVNMHSSNHATVDYAQSNAIRAHARATEAGQRPFGFEAHDKEATQLTRGHRGEHNRCKGGPAPTTLAVCLLQWCALCLRRLLSTIRSARAHLRRRLDLCRVVQRGFLLQRRGRLCVTVPQRRDHHRRRPPEACSRRWCRACETVPPGCWTGSLTYSAAAGNRHRWSSTTDSCDSAISLLAKKTVQTQSFNTPTVLSSLICLRRHPSDPASPTALDPPATSPPRDRPPQPARRSHPTRLPPASATVLTPPPQPAPLKGAVSGPLLGCVLIEATAGSSTDRQRHDERGDPRRCISYSLTPAVVQPFR